MLTPRGVAASQARDSHLHYLAQNVDAGSNNPNNNPQTMRILGRESDVAVGLLLVVINNNPNNNPPATKILVRESEFVVGLLLAIKF